MRKTVKVKKNSDGTISVRVGTYVEHISTEMKSKGQIFDAVKYAIISKEVNLADISIAELIRNA